MAEITSRTIQIVLVPRAHLAIASERPELSNVGIYFLVGPPDQEGIPQVYVGEAEDCLQRIKQHNKQKDFWQTALVCISRTQYFTKSHVKYLEWHSHQTISAAGRFRLENPTVPTCPYVSETMKADLHDNFDTIHILLSALGFPLFDELQKPSKKDLLYCRGKDAEAAGEYSGDGFVVFEGSTANLEESNSAKASWVEHLRQSLIQSGCMVAEENIYRFSRNYVFSSPSAAAVSILGRYANGWTEWKYADGRTLDEVKRRSDEPMT
ncbi:MAG: GIY-YIG nuclease family protein [Ignavibacteriales bacterium]|nr:GIY-YIG nuclease family protein [Ignavibacteriales bacterium]